MRLIKESSGREFEAWFETVAGAPTVPPSAHWRLVDTTNGLNEALTDWTAVAPEIRTDQTGAMIGVRVVVNVPGSLNRIRNRANLREGRELQIVAAKDQDQEYAETLPYYVTAMAGGRT